MASSRYTTKLSPILKNKAISNYSPSIFSLMAIIVFIIFAIHPTIKTIISLQQTINDQTTVLSNLKQKSQQLSTAINNYNSIPDDTKLKLFTLLPNSTNVTCLVSDLTNMSNNNQSTIVGLQIQQVELNRTTKCLLDSHDLENYRQNISSSVSLKEIDFTVNTQGNFSQLSNLLNSYNTSTRLINIETATFGKPGEGNLSLIINGKAYFYR